MTVSKPTAFLDLMTPPKAVMDLIPAGMIFGQRWLEAQSALASDMQSFGQHWLERRQEALRSGVAAAAEVTDGGTPDVAKMLRASRDWYAGSVDRLAADAQEGLDMVVRCGRTVTAPTSTKPRVKPMATVKAA